MSGPIAFLDRDGTLIHHIPYLCDPAQVELLPGVASALYWLKSQGYRLVLVSNQSGVGRGYFGTQEVDAVNARLQELLSEQQAQLDLLFYCVHHPQTPCDCRKPGTDMAEQARRALGLGYIPPGSFVVGDSHVDMGFAAKLGIPAYQLPNLEGSFDHCQSQALKVQCQDWPSIERCLRSQLAKLKEHIHDQ